MASLNKRYSRNTKGFNAQGFVSVTNAAALPATEGHTTFEQNSGGTVTYVDGTALNAGDSYRILQLQDGELANTISFKGSDILSITNVNYDAPVLQLDKMAITGAAIDAALGVAGLKEFVVAARDTTPSNQPFPVEEARATVRNTTTSAYDVFHRLAVQVNRDFDYERNADESFVTAIVENDGVAGAVTVAASAVLQQGSNVAVFNAAPTGPTVGEFISFQAPNAGDAPDLYRITAIDGANVSLDRNWNHPTATVLIADMLVGAATSGDWNFGFVAKTVGTHFSSIATEDLDGYPFATITAWKQGTGDPESVSIMEEEFAVYKGETTINAQWREDYGISARFTDSAQTYGLSIIKYKKTTASMAFANEQAHHVGYIMLALAGGTSAGIALA